MVRPVRPHTHTGSRRFVHLAEHHGRLIDNARIGHLIVKVISLTGTLTNACKYGISAVLCRNISDQLLNQDCLTYTGTAKSDRSFHLSGTAEEINRP